MAKMTKDLMLNDNKFSTAVSDMKALKKRTNQLKNDLSDLYDDLVSALEKRLKLKPKKRF